MSAVVSGFSKKSKQEKIAWLSTHYLKNNEAAVQTLKQYWNTDLKLQQIHDDFIENTLSNYYLPFAVAPNFLINSKLYAIPMVIEESSVVAAASLAAKFWLERGGFKAQVISTKKKGQIHILYQGNFKQLNTFFKSINSKILNALEPLQRNMKQRGGGVLEFTLADKTEALGNYFQIDVAFNTQNAMGANFINSCLETIAKTFEAEATHYPEFKTSKVFPEVVMSILSNYVPECIVRAEVSCPVAALAHQHYKGAHFGNKLIQAIAIAKAEVARAVTHNKGIMNGVDAVVVATGNDFRAVEAGVHAYAARQGRYTSLTDAKIENNQFSFWIEIPLALGTVGGLTTLHPLVKTALNILQQPTAEDLMQITAVAGLAQNFAALRSLVTTGIQKGHMKMHLMNILNQLEATEIEKQKAISHFAKKPVSHQAVSAYMKHIRL